jgi:hypothetical protein
MLCVRIDGHEVEMTSALLARRVFEGEIDRDSVARRAGETTEQSLEEALGSGYGEALTAELHQRLCLICATDSSAVDVQELCARVERLCQWRWPNSPATARFFWAAAWLNELTGRTKNAIDFYDAFLLLPAGESHLRRLALNNRGVLQIQLGRLDGVEDLVRAAITDCGFRIVDCGSGSACLSHPPSAIRDPKFVGLPAACFNLLNLINVAFGSPDLLRSVDEELTGFFAPLGPEVRSRWLGELSELEADDPQGGAANPPPGDSEGRVPILRDPTYRRLNALVTRLSAAAHRLAAGLHHSMDRPSAVFRRLSLWDCRLPDDPSGPQGTRPGDDRFVEGEGHRYAEAAALLLSDDIPSCLTRQDHPLARLEPSIQEELAVIEGHLAAGQYELARSRLLVQRRILESLDERYGLAPLLRYVDAQVERIGHLEAQEERFQVQKACGRLVAEVEEFCTRTDGAPAQSAWEDLQRRVQQLRARLTPQTNGEAIALLDDLAARGRRRVQELKREQVEKTIGESLLHLRQNRPSDWTVPVPESVYRALAQCRLHDPENWVEDWPALQEQLDAHQGRYYTYKILSACQSGVRWGRIEGDLIQALVHQPDQWLTLASLFGWQANEGGLRTAECRSAPAVSPNPPSAIRNPQFPVDRAGAVLAKALEQIGPDAKKCLRLWQSVETTLAPALAGRDVKALGEARTLAERCLDHWPAGLSQDSGCADPRHPVNRFLEACEKARRLVEAEQLLGARPPRLDEARHRFVGILQSGVNAREQLRRIVTGLYLAQFQKDPPPVQRQVLADLEAWVAKVPLETVPQIQGQEIVAETEKARGAVTGRSEPGACPA